VGKIEGLEMAVISDYAGNNHWMNLVQIESEIYGKDKEGLMSRLEQNGIQSRPVWALNHLQNPY